MWAKAPRNSGIDYMTAQNAPSVPLDFAPRQRSRFNPHLNRRLGDPNTHSIDDVHLQADYLTYLTRHQVEGISAEEKQEKEDFRLELESVAREAIDKYVRQQSIDLKPELVYLRCYGSLKSGFAVPGSDLDLLLWFAVEDKTKLGSLPEECKRLLEKTFLDRGYGAHLLTKTRVPILRVCQRPGPNLKKTLKAERQHWEDEVDEEKKEASMAAKGLDPNRLPVSDGKASSPDHEMPASTIPLPASPDRRRPDLEFKDVGVQCDINFSNHVAYYNSELFRLYSILDYRVVTMGVFIKTWAKTRKINTPYHGTLSSYGWLSLMIHFLMNVADPPVLPNLQHLALDADAWKNVEMKDVQLFEGHDIRFFGRIDVLMDRVRKNTVTANRQPVGELIREFFYYFADPRGFHWVNNAVSIRSQGGLRTKRSKGWTESKWGGENNSVKMRYMLAIEDPFEIDHNIARTVCHSGLMAIRGEFDRAWGILSRMKYSSGRYQFFNMDGSEGEPLLTVANDRGDLLRLDQAFYRDKQRELAGGPNRQAGKDGNGSVGSNEDMSKRVSYNGPGNAHQNRGPHQTSPKLMNAARSSQGPNKPANDEKFQPKPQVPPRAPLKWEDSDDPIPDANNFETKVEVRSIRTGAVTTIEIPNHQRARDASRVASAKFGNAGPVVQKSPGIPPGVTAASIHGLVVPDEKVGRLEKMVESLDVQEPQSKGTLPIPKKMDPPAPKKVDVAPAKLDVPELNKLELSTAENVDTAVAPKAFDVGSWVSSYKDAWDTTAVPVQESTEVNGDATELNDDMTTAGRPELTAETKACIIIDNPSDTQSHASTKSLSTVSVDANLWSDPRNPMSAWNTLIGQGQWLSWRDYKIRRGTWKLGPLKKSLEILNNEHPFDFRRPAANWIEQERTQEVRARRMQFFNTTKDQPVLKGSASEVPDDAPTVPRDFKYKKHKKPNFKERRAQKEGLNGDHKDEPATGESNTHEHDAITNQPHPSTSNSAPKMPPVSPVNETGDETHSHKSNIPVDKVKSKVSESAQEDKSVISPEPEKPYKSIFGPPIDNNTATQVDAQVNSGKSGKMIGGQVDGAYDDERYKVEAHEDGVHEDGPQEDGKPAKETGANPSTAKAQEDLEVEAPALAIHQPHRKYRKGDVLPSHSNFTMVLSTNDPDITVSDDEGKQIPYFKYLEIQAARKAARQAAAEQKVEKAVEVEAENHSPVFEEILARSQSPIEIQHEAIATPGRPNFPFDPAQLRQLAIIQAGGNVCVRDKWT